MALIAAWVVAVLGIGHIIVGLVFFRKPIAEAVSEGGFGRFQHADRRRLAFWFTIFGPLVLAVGHTAIIAATRGDVLLLKTMGYYLLGTSILGVVAMPKSPFWFVLVVSPVIIGAGYGWWN